MPGFLIHSNLQTGLRTLENSEQNQISLHDIMIFRYQHKQGTKFLTLQIGYILSMTDK